MAGNKSTCVTCCGSSQIIIEDDGNSQLCCRLSSNETGDDACKKQQTNNRSSSSSSSLSRFSLHTKQQRSLSAIIAIIFVILSTTAIKEADALYCYSCTSCSLGGVSQVIKCQDSQNYTFCVIKSGFPMDSRSCAKAPCTTGSQSTAGNPISFSYYQTCCNTDFCNSGMTIFGHQTATVMAVSQLAVLFLTSFTVAASSFHR